MSALEELEKRLLGLPLAQRVFLAESLLDSLPPLDEDLEKGEEMAEVKCREEEIETGKVQPLKEAEFWQSLEADHEG